MAIDLLRGVALLDRGVRSGEWDYAVEFPRRIARATLGVVGFSRIGRVAASRGRALGMPVVAHDAFVSDAAVRETGTVPCASLLELMAAADVVTLHAAHTDAARGLVAAAALAAMRPGSFLVNFSRAGLVDPSGARRGAALGAPGRVRARRPARGAAVAASPP